jgi:hypothetical protein
MAECNQDAASSGAESRLVWTTRGLVTEAVLRRVACVLAVSTAHPRREELPVTEPQRLPRDRAVLVEYGGHMEPELRVGLGERFVIETNDNWFNLLGEDGAVPSVAEPPVAARQYLRANPVGGPVYVSPSAAARCFRSRS